VLHIRIIAFAIHAQESKKYQRSFELELSAGSSVFVVNKTMHCIMEGETSRLPSWGCISLARELGNLCGASGGGRVNEFGISVVVPRLGPIM